ncbi:hypothetical protein BDY19DRAFT_908515 [Irpex rosettiformis]|uniref:Uncharacterized protein n=1 Tax=Irpex rosettiformis TaxID=378272 RepID=A0ACB8TWE9_9APHY|nr:hypothetical protein BDY19DRAFT_908515 [Irpex rosettiformis]
MLRRESFEPGATRVRTYLYIFFVIIVTSSEDRRPFRRQLPPEVAHGWDSQASWTVPRGITRDHQKCLPNCSHSRTAMKPALRVLIPFSSFKRAIARKFQSSPLGSITPFPHQLSPTQVFVKTERCIVEASSTSEAVDRDPCELPGPNPQYGLQFGASFLSGNMLLSLIFTEFSPCPSVETDATTFWISLDACHPGVWDQQAYMQLEVQEGATVHTTDDLLEAWRLCLFPRVLPQAQLEEFLEARFHRTYRMYGESVAIETLAIGADTLKEAEALVDEIHFYNSTSPPYRLPFTNVTSSHSPRSSHHQGPPSAAYIIVEFAASTNNLAIPFPANHILPHNPIMHLAHSTFLKTGRRVMKQSSLVFPPNDGEMTRMYQHLSHLMVNFSVSDSSASSEAHASAVLPQVLSIDSRGSALTHPPRTLLLYGLAQLVLELKRETQMLADASIDLYVAILLPTIDMPSAAIGGDIVNRVNINRTSHLFPVPLGGWSILENIQGYTVTAKMPIRLPRGAIGVHRIEYFWY